MADKKSLVKKLIEVSKGIGYLQKDKTNKMQGYNYLSEAKIKETIKKQFEEQGVIFHYSTEQIREYEISPTSKGTKQFVTVANGTYRFIDVDSDADISGTWFGSGTDTGDKGLYKAITGGIKYVLNTNFLIPTGDDPEKDNDDDTNKEPENKTKPAAKPAGADIKGDDAEAELKRALIKKYQGSKKVPTAQDIENAKAEFKKMRAAQKLVADMEAAEKEKAGNVNPENDLTEEEKAEIEAALDKEVQTV